MADDVQVKFGADTAGGLHGEETGRMSAQPSELDGDLFGNAVESFLDFLGRANQLARVEVDIDPAVAIPIAPLSSTAAPRSAARSAMMHSLPSKLGLPTTRLRRSRHERQEAARRVVAQNNGPKKGS
jgi:hypothetical protein